MIKSFLSALLCTLLLAGIATTAPAQDTANGALIAYEHGPGALQIFDEEGRANTPEWVQHWLMVMLGSFALGLVFVWKKVEARWVVGGIVATFVAVQILVKAFGLLPLGGLLALVHIVTWSPGLYILLTRRPFLAKPGFYSLWSGWITAVILFSFAFDIPDALTYLQHMLG